MRRLVAGACRPLVFLSLALLTIVQLDAQQALRASESRAHWIAR